MSRQYPHGNADDTYKKKLFFDNGFGYQEVKARIVEPYTPPFPQPKTVEVKIINAPSHIHQMGLSSYKTTFSLLFNSKLEYAEYMSYVGWGHKFYDERGQIYVGAVESIKSKAYEANRRYLVEIALILVKKNNSESKYNQEMPFQDISKDAFYYKDLEEMTRLGMISSITRDGQPVLYFRPDDHLTRAEMVTLLIRTKNLIENMVRE